MGIKPPYTMTRDAAAAGAASAWAVQYADQHWDGTEKRAIGRELLALGPKPDPDAVDRIIGNGSWTACTCDQCGASVGAVVTVGQTPDYDSSTADLCIDCARQAVAMLEAALQSIGRD